MRLRVLAAAAVFGVAGALVGIGLQPSAAVPIRDAWLAPLGQAQPAGSVCTVAQEWQMQVCHLGQP